MNFYVSQTQFGKTEQFALQVARGQIQGHTSLNISGYNGNVNSTFIPIWENNTAYTYPTTAQHMTLYSSSASDTNVLVSISGLDASYHIISENLLLDNGTTGVQTLKQYFRITSVIVIDGVNPVGDLTLSNTGKTIVYAKVLAGSGRSAMTIYTVPAGHTFYLAKVNCFCDQSNNQVSNYRSYTINSSGIVTTILQAPFTQNYISDKSVPRGYPEKTDIQWQCKSSATSQIGLQIEGVLIKTVID